MEPRRKAQFLQEAARTHRYGPILWLVGPSNSRTRSSPPLSFNCRHICTGRPPQQSLGPLTAGLRVTSLRRCRRRQGCPMKSAASRGAPGEGEERGGRERRGERWLCSIGYSFRYAHYYIILYYRPSRDSNTSLLSGSSMIILLLCVCKAS